MATARKIPVPPIEPDYTVELTLSKDEAELLAGVLGGMQYGSPGERIFDALVDAKVSNTKWRLFLDDGSGMFTTVRR